jgi:hypothetical protein
MDVMFGIVFFTALGVGLALAITGLSLSQRYAKLEGEFGVPPVRGLLRIGGWLRRLSRRVEARLTPPSERLMSLAHGHIVSQYMVHVVRSGIADRFDKDPRPAAAVAEQLGLHEESVCHILRVLAAHGCFEAVGGADNMYRHNSVSVMLRADHPQSMRPVMLLLAETYAPWDHLPDMLSTGQPVFCAWSGRPFWEAGVPSLGVRGGVRTGKGMLRDSETARYRLGEAALLADHRWEQYKRIVDLGEGPGRLLAAILEAHKSVTGVVWKRGPMIRSAKAWWERLDEGIQARVQFSAGERYQDLRGLRSGDALLLGCALSTQDDETATEALLGLRRRIGTRDVTLLVADMVLEARESDRVKLTMDAQVRGLGPIKHRTRAAWAALLLAGGFHLERVVECRGQAWLIEGSSVKGFVCDEEDAGPATERQDGSAQTTHAA